MIGRDRRLRHPVVPKGPIAAGAITLVFEALTPVGKMLPAMGGDLPAIGASQYYDRRGALRH